MNDTRAIISQLLRNIGSSKEVDQYLKQFSEVESAKFAVIKVRGDIIRDDLESLCSALTFLYRVALYPIVVHGSGAQVDAALLEEGLPIQTRDGRRVADGPTLRVARRVTTSLNHDLVDALERMGTRARAIPAGVFRARRVEELGYHGHITGIDADPIRAAIKSGHLPILSCVAESDEGQLLLVPARVAALELARAVGPAKIIFLTPEGGLTDDTGKLLRSFNLAEDYEWMMTQPFFSESQRLKFAAMKELLDVLPLSSSIALTAPSLLPRELFTHRGSGTLIRRGEKVLCHEGGLEHVDVPRLKALLEEGFGRPLVADYFNKKGFYRVYVTESYRAAAILTLEGDLPYLDKFVVDEEAQGEGLAGSLWDRLVEDNPRLFWRSRVDNTKINPWYFSRAEGSLRNGRWVVFWYGLEGFGEVQEAIAKAIALPPSLESVPLPEGS